MRAFSFHSAAPSVRAARSAVTAACLALASVPASPVAAQWPGEVAGRVVEAGTGRPVPGAEVLLEGADARHAPVSSDGSGRFLLRGVDPGPRTLLVRHPSYAPGRERVDVAPGRTARVLVELEPAPLAVEGVEVRVPAAGRAGFRVRPGPGERAGTVGDLLRRAPGVVVRDRGEGGPQTVSVRGSAPDQVLVLVDGVPLNDPLTGTADLSLVSAASVEEVVVLPGARSAEWGARAQAGVVLVETRAPAGGVRLRAGAGSLGRTDAGLEAGGMLGGSTGWAASLLREGADGAFDFGLPAAVGGGRARRENADVRRSVATASLDGRHGSGALSVRLRAEVVRRGLPGRSFAPSPRARQDDERLQLSAGWKGALGELPLDVRVHGAARRSHLRDPAPPAGPPWDDRVRAWSGGLGLRAGPGDPAAPLGVGGGLDVEAQRVRADALDDGAPRRILRGGAFLSVAGEGETWGVPVTARLTGRLDVGSGDLPIVGSHEAVLSVHPLSGLTVDAAYRSAFSPPTLADQYFRAGVGVEPNPGLRGERVPGETELGVSVSRRVGRTTVSARVAAYRGDVRDMIVWAPDFRFVWSPANVDVLRRGLEARAELRLPVGPAPLVLGGGWSRARTTYADRTGDVQLRYRPRHTADLSASWHHPFFRIGLEGRYTGARLPVPARVNVLPGFWSFDLDLSARLRVHGWRLEPSLGVERLFDARDSMIFGFPEPGRTLSFRLAVVTPGGGRPDVSPSSTRSPR